MSNLGKDQPSTRVNAPPGGYSSNMFSTSESEQSAANKKKQSESDIFGSKKDTTEQMPTAKQNRNTGNNIFGTDPGESNVKASTLAGQYKQTQMKSNIFGTDEPTSTRPVSDKNKSNIFGTSDNDEQNKRQQGGRQGVRGGYNPISGESYPTKGNANPKSNENDATVENANGQKPDNENNAQKNVHTSVRVFQPPGGKSNGPLW